MFSIKVTMIALLTAFTTKWLLNLTPDFDTLLMEKEF